MSGNVEYSVVSLLYKNFLFFWIACGNIARIIIHNEGDQILRVHIQNSKRFDSLHLWKMMVFFHYEADHGSSFSSFNSVYCAI